MWFGQKIQALPRAIRLNLSAAALASPILVLGAPRSGTTWLAKIIDSHPDVIYRHEPDTAVRPPARLAPTDIPGLVERWAAERGARTVTKRPFFAKSWQPAWARGVRTGIAGAVGVVGRLPAAMRPTVRIQIPDLAMISPARLAIKSIDWSAGASVLARALPASRTLFILRHPCGQVASVMRGNRQRRFDLQTIGTDMPFDELSATSHAAMFGTDASAFQALPDAGKYAWAWRAFNEPAYAALAMQTNVHVLLYEALCAHPDEMARRVLAFAGLGWNDQTAQFVARSTSHQGSAGYYAIYRNAIAAAEDWRASMPSCDADSVRAVMSTSPLARFWPDVSGSCTPAL